MELVEKQKIRFQYGLSDSGLKRMVGVAGHIRGKTRTQALLELLERRLDNTVYRLGLAGSRRIAQHLVSYGFISMNGKPAKIPSRLVRPGDVISIREAKRTRGIVAGLAVHLKKHTPPSWLELNPESWTGTVKRLPSEEDGVVPMNLSKVIEFYSR
jgi:small subunit ribosomal protein S4